jgi:hypothetical protein
MNQGRRVTSMKRTGFINDSREAGCVCILCNTLPVVQGAAAKFNRSANPAPFACVSVNKNLVAHDSKEFRGVIRRASLVTSGRSLVARGDGLLDDPGSARPSGLACGLFEFAR